MKTRYLGPSLPCSVPISFSLIIVLQYRKDILPLLSNVFS